MYQQPQNHTQKYISISVSRSPQPNDAVVIRSMGIAIGLVNGVLLLNGGTVMCVCVCSVSVECPFSFLRLISHGIVARKFFADDLVPELVIECGSHH